MLEVMLLFESDEDRNDRLALWIIWTLGVFLNN